MMTNHIENIEKKRIATKNTKEDQVPDCKSKRMYEVEDIIKKFIRMACTNNHDEIRSLNIILISGK